MYEKSAVAGTIIYEDKVIQNTVGITVSSCYGVVEMASVNRMRNYIFDNFSKDKFDKGVGIRTYEAGVIDLDIHIVVGYSIPVQTICEEIKKRVAYELEKNLNIKAREIVIFVEAIDRIG